MDHESSSRKKFLQYIGLTAGGTLLNGGSMASTINDEEIRKLRPGQLEFMVRYDKWMDNYIEVIRTQSKDPYNVENQQAKVALTQKAAEFKPELAVHMQDAVFALIFTTNLQRMTNEIKL